MFATAAGFVAAGLVTSFHHWVTARPLEIVMGGSVLAITVATILWVVIGPLLLLRAVFAASTGTKAVSPRIAAGAVAATIWSCCSGILIIGAILTIT